MRAVKRTMERHVIHPAIVTVKNGMVTTEGLEPIDAIDTTINEEKALKLAQKTYGKKNQYVILGIDTFCIEYEMTGEEFLAHARVVESYNKADKEEI